MEHLIKQSLIIGSFALVFCLACMAIELGDLYVKLSWEMPEERRDNYVTGIAVRLALFCGGAIISSLLIWGAKKRRHFAIIPSGLCVLVAMGFTIFFMGYNLVLMPFGQFELLQTTVPILGVEVLIFHVLTTTFKEIRRQRAEQPQGSQHANYYDKI
ncbi:uncharacterized protein LOC101889163 [Musca domestica]|uniref:Uncharacterized protein LOC101889163 n=1 Tax=Musca domestica TaxID=7370 RepID=A0A1I8MNB5_MUSDO|nr:uncharacterized protein LOC101889163 [Musca domestica]